MILMYILLVVLQTEVLGPELHSGHWSIGLAVFDLTR
jgi:hypothetical protein